MPRTLTATFVLFLAAASAGPALAQIAGDGASLPSPEREERAANTFENYKYLIFGLATPSGSYGEVPTLSTVPTAPYVAGRGAESGYFVELGGTRYVYEPAGSLPLGVGVGYGLSYSMFSIDWQGLYGFDESAEVETDGFEAVLDFRLGPSVAYQPVPGLTVGASFKLGPGVSMMQDAYIYEFGTGGAGRSASDTYEEMPVAFGLRTSFGIDARFGPLMGGLEFHRGSATFGRSIDNGSAFNTYDAEVGINATRLYLGLSF